MTKVASSSSILVLAEWPGCYLDPLLISEPFLSSTDVTFSFILFLVIKTSIQSVVKFVITLRE